MQKESSIAQAVRRKYPEQVVIVTTRAADGAPNAMAVGWAMIASSDPLMFALGIDDEAYTYELIRETKEFVVAFPSSRMAKEVLYVGTRHGRGIDKLAECGLATEKATAVGAPLIAHAVANFECRLVDVVRPGNCPILFGEVVAAHEHVNPNIARLYTVGPGHLMGSVAVRPSRHRDA